jgi:hypothetical protein
MATDCQADFERSAVPNADQGYFSLLFINPTRRRCPRHVWIPRSERRSKVVAIPKLVEIVFDWRSRTEDTEGTEDTEVSRIWFDMRFVSVQRHVGRLPLSERISGC